MEAVSQEGHASQSKEMTKATGAHARLGSDSQVVLWLDCSEEEGW